MRVMLEEGGIVIRHFLEGLPVKNWAKAFSNGCRYGEMTSSAVESCNSWVINIRCLDIILVDGIRSKLMKWQLERKEASYRWTTILCKRIGDRIHECMETVRTWGWSRSNMYIFEVRTDLSYTVNALERSCSCGKWQTDRFPCDHALKCFMHSNLDLLLYIESYFFTCEYRNAYAEPIYQVPTSLRAQFEHVGLSKIKPPVSKRHLGRPKKLRYRSRVEKMKNTSFTCGRCGKQ